MSARSRSRPFSASWPGRITRILGEGALAGLVAGSALGGWETGLSQDLTHRMYRLAAGRMAASLVVGGTLGMLLSAALALLFAGLRRRGRRGFLAGRIAVGALYAAGVYAAAFPLRNSFFYLHRFSNKVLSVVLFAVVMGTVGMILALRAEDPIPGGAEGAPGNGPPRPGGRIRLAASMRRGAVVVGMGVFVMAVAARVCLPLLPAVRPSNGMSVILVSIDTLRADRLGVMGNPRDLTPHLDSLAREGALFEEASSTAPWTLPSHASLFTSLLPFDHRVQWDASAFYPFHTLLAEHFRDARYRTAAFTGGGYVSGSFGFSQGFEVYEDHHEVKEGGPEPIVAAALKWVRGVHESPFFLFVHTYEPHSPYSHPDRAGPEDAGGLPRVFGVQEVDDVHLRRLKLSPAQRRYVTDLYDGDVAHADRVIGGLLETLRREGILDHALLVVVSDHGEDFWDHDLGWSPGHGHSLYEEILHVPLLVRAPGVVRSGLRIRTPVSLLDVAPTLLELAGLPPDPNHQGSSLAESLRTGAEPEAHPIAAESIEYGPDRFVLRQGAMKVILTPLPKEMNSGIPIQAEPLEVFDLAEDPLERHRLSGALGGPAAEMVETLWLRAERVLKPLRGDRGRKMLPEALREQLRSLGYIH